jgi:hypothetical protein
VGVFMCVRLTSCGRLIDSKNPKRAIKLGKG